MKFKRASYLTRLAALGVATATLIVPFGAANAADTKNSVSNNSAYVNDANASSIKKQFRMYKNNSVSHKLTRDENLYLDSNKAALLEKYAIKNSASVPNKPIAVIVTLRKQPSRPSVASEKSNKDEQNRLIDKWRKKYNMSVRRQLGYLMNCFEATIPANRMQALRHEPEVRSVEKERLYYPLENFARELQGLTQAFRESNKNLDGTGMLVSIIDTGIDINSKDMKLDSSAKSAKKLNPQPGFTDKVPAGFNYADETNEVKDNHAEQHGMHVAGIVGANGDEENAPATSNHRVNGIAPNAQLLAMKVFSNNPDMPGCRDADVVAAIEDSVKLGADVINMSIGSDNGLDSTSSIAALALMKARKAGVLPVVSAGNSGLNFSNSGGLDDVFGKWDDGTLGSPSSFPDAFSVASVENSKVTQTKAQWFVNNASATNSDSNDSKKNDFPYSLSTGVADGRLHEIVDINLGKKDDVKDLDLKGKYALVKRGDIAFTEKVNNAKEKGAEGVVVYNVKDDPTQFLDMAGVDKIKDVFVTSIRYEDGEAIYQAIKKNNGKVEVTFTNDFVAIANPDSLKPSRFTSWGPTPDLNFKPHISGIGGNVWSTQNDNKYRSMSGTSMAAPNISGLSALLMENYKKRFKGKELKPSELVDRIEQVLMNTAKILTRDDGNKKVPYAPRQIGAGLAQLDKAIKTDVVATTKDSRSNESKAYASLYELKQGERKFNVTLHNYGSENVKYSIPNQVVVNETNKPGEKTSTFVNDKETLTADKSSVIVEAGKTVDITFTLNPQYGENHYIEGWACLKSKTKGQPDLSVPYLGFVGNWNAEQILVKPGEKYKNADKPAKPVNPAQNPSPAAPNQSSDESNGEIDSTTALMSDSADGSMQVKINGSKRFMFSPNDDGWYDLITPYVPLLRSAADIRYEIMDENATKVLRVLGEDHNVSRPTLPSAADSMGHEGVNGRFDGKRYDPKIAQFVRFEDGNYVYRIQARLGKEFPWQNYDMKFALDTHGPDMNVSDRDSNGVVTITLSDNLSEDPGLPVIRRVGDDDVFKYDDATGCTLDKVHHKRVCKINVGNTTPFISVVAKDAGMNGTRVVKVFANKDHKIFISRRKEMDGKMVGTSVVRDNKLRLEGYVSDDVKSMKVLASYKKYDETTVNQTVKVNLDKAPKFTTDNIKIVRGENTVKVLGFSDDKCKTQIASEELTLTYNPERPRISVTNTDTGDSDGNLPVASDGSVTVKGKVKDSSEPKQKLDLTIRYQVDKVRQAAGSTDPGSSNSSSESAEDLDDTETKEDPVTINSDGTFEVTVKPSSKAYQVTLCASNGQNLKIKSVKLQGRNEPNFMEVSNGVFYPSNVTPLGANIWMINPITAGPSLDSFTLQGTVGPDIKSVEFTPSTRLNKDGKYALEPAIAAKIDSQAHSFSIDLPMRTGINDFRAVVKTADGKNLMDFAVAFLFDKEAPKATFANPQLYGHTLFTNKDTVKFKGSAQDNASGYRLSINHSVVAEFTSLENGDGPEANKKEFERDVDVEDGDHVFLELEDKVNSSVYGSIPVVVDKTNPTVDVSMKDDESVEGDYTVTIKAKDANLKSIAAYVDDKPISAVSNTNLAPHPVESTLLSLTQGYSSYTEVDKPEKDHLELKAVIHAKDLAEGNHILRVEATDYAGNSAAGDNQRTSIPFVKKKHAEPVKPDHSKPDVPGHNVNPNVPKKQEIPAPPDVNTPVPVAPKSVVELTKALKSNLLVGKYENNVARAGVENPMKLRLSQNSDIIKQLKKNKVVYAYAYIYSLPVLLHGKDGASYVKVTLDDKGQPHFDAEIPEGYSGKHTIVLIDNRGLQIAWTNVWVIPANATSFDETIAEYNLRHSESHSGFTFASSDEDYESASNIADNNEVNGSETNSGAYAGANGNANSSNVNGNSKNANNNANSSLSNSLSSSKNTNTKGMLSKLGVTGAGIVFTLSTLALLLLSGTFALFVRKMRM